MRGQRHRALVVLVLSLLVSGCMSMGNPSVMDQARVAQITLNVSTKADVRRILGEPNGIARQSGSEAPLPGLPPITSADSTEKWSYTYTTVALDAATFVPIVGLFAGGATTNVATFTVAFDVYGIVRHIASEQVQIHSN